MATPSKWFPVDGLVQVLIRLVKLYVV